MQTLKVESGGLMTDHATDSPEVKGDGALPMTHQDPVSVVINVHNEAETIAVEIRAIHATIIARLPGSELIVAEDGSTDGTKEIIQQLTSELGIIHSTSPERKGYAKALRDAFALTKSPYVFFSDTGGKLDFSQFWQLYSLRHSYDFVLGRRTARNDQIYRRMLTWGYNFLLRKYFMVKISDADCGFRLYSKECVDYLITQSWINKYLVGSELVIRAAARGFKVGEVPITYLQRSGVSRGLPPRTIPKVIFVVLKNFKVLKAEIEAKRSAA